MFDIMFDRIRKANTYGIKKVFDLGFIRSRRDKYDGNHDYIKLHLKDRKRYWIHKPVYNQPTDGIWYTKSQKADTIIYDQKPKDALTSHQSNFPDGWHELVFKTEDASGKSDMAKMRAMVDNFQPFILETIVRSKDSSFAYKWSLDETGDSLKFSTETKSEGTNSDSIQFEFYPSETLTRFDIFIPELDSAWFTPTFIKEQNKWILEFPKKSLEELSSLTIVLEARDLAGNDLIDFDKSQKIGFEDIPKRHKKRKIGRRKSRFSKEAFEWKLTEKVKAESIYKFPLRKPH